MKSFFFLFIALLVTTPVFAEKLVFDSKHHLICNETDMTKEPIGTVCITYSLIWYKHIEINGEPAIQDIGRYGIESGKIWFDALEDRVTQEQAAEICKSRGQRLPTREEFETARERGFQNVYYRELFGWDGHPKRYWSSSPDVGYRLFNGTPTSPSVLGGLICRALGCTMSARCVNE